MVEMMVPMHVLLEWVERAVRAEQELERVTGPSHCVVCNTVLTGARRSTKRYCSGTCKSAAAADQRRLRQVA